jgi:hypothetical protein
MGNSTDYWKPICDLTIQLRSWVRFAASDGGARWITDWSMLLLIPTTGYLEAGEGPVPIRCVEWVELSTCRLRGGLAGRPLEVIDMTEGITSFLAKSSVHWEWNDTKWSLPGIVEDAPVRVVRIANLFYSGPASFGPS